MCEKLGMNKISFIVGLDLDENTTLTMINLKSEYTKEPVVKIKVKGESNFITAIAYHPKKGILIGDPAITTEGVSESYLGLIEQSIINNPSYPKILADYVSYIIKEVKVNGYGITDENTLFIIGCPPTWTTNNTILYEMEIRTKAQLSQIKLISKSRGAVQNAIVSGDVYFALSLRYRVLVVYIGLSTTNFALIDVEKRGINVPDLTLSYTDLVEFGYNLGTSLIDKLLFWHLLNQHKRKNEVIVSITNSSINRSRCELACRKAKEIWFKTPDSTSRVFVEIIQDELEFRGRVTSDLMKKILESPLTELRDMESIYGESFAYLSGQSWQDELKTQLARARDVAERLGKLPDVVVFTGEDSQMPFLVPACQNILPKSRIICNPETEYATSRGLAYWGRDYVQTG